MPRIVLSKLGLTRNSWECQHASYQGGPRKRNILLCRRLHCSCTRLDCACPCHLPDPLTGEPKEKYRDQAGRLPFQR